MNSSYHPPHGVNLGYLLAQSAHAWHRAVTDTLRPFELTPSQFFLLMAVFYYQSKEERLPTQKEAAVEATLDLNVASQITKKLIQRGVLQRHAHAQDGRAYQLSITELGKTLANDSSAAVRSCNNVFFQHADSTLLASQLEQLLKENR